MKCRVRYRVLNGEVWRYALVISPCPQSRKAPQPSTLKPVSSDSMFFEPSAPSFPNFFRAFVSTSTPVLQSATFRVVVLSSSGSVNFISLRFKSSKDGLFCGVPGRKGTPKLRYVGGDGFIDL